MRVLGIETSCDDTGVAIYDSRDGLLIHRLASQIDLHRQYGGVVPELAARDHIRSLLPLIDTVLHSTKNRQHAIQAIAYTAGPGLAGALMVGAAVARGLATAWQLPAIGVHHLEGHLLAVMLEATPPKPPFLALLVSGGHSLLVDVKQIGDYTILGRSLDDAAGEAFDKTAKILGLDYPGGPAIAAAARHGRAARFTFPRPMTRRTGLDLSFSGLKTHALTTAQQHPLDRQTICDIARAFEDAVVDTLTIKSLRALKHSGRRTLVVSGGVGANLRLRTQLKTAAAKHATQVYYPRLELCTDNGAMIAYAGYVRLQMQTAAKSEVAATKGFEVKPRWSLEEVCDVSG